MEEFSEKDEFLSFLLSSNRSPSDEKTKKRFSSFVKKAHEKESGIYSFRYDIEYFILPNGKKHGKETMKNERTKEICYESEYKNGLLVNFFTNRENRK